MTYRYSSIRSIALLATIWLIFGFPFTINGQSVTNYTFSASSGSFTALSGGQTMALTGGTVDDGWFNSVPVGFTFYYMGTAYTTVSASTNGFLTFGQALSGAVSANNLSTGTTRPFVAPLWDDLSLQVNTNFSYQTSGSPGSQIFTAEWLNMKWNYNSTGTQISFQVKLYEATGVIEFVYRDEGGTVNSGTASIGLTALTGSGSGTFLSLNGTGVSPTASSTTETTTLSTKPASGQVFTFTPQAGTPVAPTSLSLTAGYYGIALTWTDNSSNETFFQITRATDAGFTTNVVTSTVASTTIASTGTNYSITQSGLTPNTQYYYKIVASNEGMPSSSELTGNTSTLSSPSLTGTKTIGGGGSPDFATLTAAFNAISFYGLADNLNLELQSGYSSASETFPITPAAASTMGNYSVTIYPAVSGLSITSANTTGTLNLNGCKKVYFDGRVGATGTGRDLIIENTATAGYAVQFVNDAVYNKLQYCVIRGANTSATAGVIVFGTTTGTTGNDNNTIDNCDIRNAAADNTTNLPTNGIYATGTTGKDNDNNTISNCSIYNFFTTSASTVGIGIYITSYNTDWTISGNSIFQPATRTFSAAGTGYIGISISNTSGVNFSVTGNYIGGQSANAGGSAWSQTGAFTHTFIGMRFSVSATTASSVQGNYIKNLSISTSNTSNINAGISVTSGLVNVGNVSGNTIGDMTTNSITYTCAGTASGFAGLQFGSGTPVQYNIQNNNIGGITVNGTGTTTLRGIWLQGTPGTSITPTISNNTIGGDVANSISNSTNLQIYGINISSTSANWSPTISNNTVRNLTASNTGTGVLCYGIYLQSGGSHTVTGNTVRNLTCASTSSTINMIGIMLSNTSSINNTISQNTVHTLEHTNASGTPAHVNGIYYNAGTTGTSTISRNLIHSLKLSTSATTTTNTQIKGIQLQSGVATVANNMIRLGIDAVGASIAPNYYIIGIDKASSSTVNIYFNSIYIGGTGASGTQNSYALKRGTSGTADDFRNNILVNARANSTGTGKHYGIVLNNTSALTCNNNLYYVSGTGGVFGNDGTADRNTFALWQSNTTFDRGSAHGSPGFVNATGNSSAVDLHVTGTTPVEGSGVDIASITNDYDGDTRSGLTPTDIGADAGSFTANDIFVPVISYTSLTNSASTSATKTLTATITDYTGVPTTGSLQPRIYYKKGAGSYFSSQGVLSSGNANNGTWTFTITYADMGGVAVNDVISYYVIAQDQAGTPNISSQAFGVTATDVNTITSAPGTPLTFTVKTAFSGTYTVGPSDPTYTSLTGAAGTPGGLFAAINGGVLTGNVTISITGDITEAGTNGLSQWVEEGTGGYTLTIQPSSASVKNLTGTYAGALIRLDGCDRVTIDGRYGGSGRYLLFRNANTTNPTINIQSDALNNTIQYCVIEGANTGSTSGVVFITPGTTFVTGNDNNTIANNQIKDAATVPANLIYSAGYSTSVKNSNNSILNNELFNFTGTGIFLATSNSANENFTITGNTIYQAAARSSQLYGMQLNTLGTSNVVSQNTIRDLNTSGSVYGIYLDDVGTVLVSKNRIYGFPSSSGSTGTIIGIYSPGSTNGVITVVNNQVSIIPAFTNAQTIYGIRDWGNSGDTFNAYYNTVYIGGTGSGTNKSYAFEDNVTTTTDNLRNNIFVNARTGGTGGHFAARTAGTSSITDQDANNNFFAGNGPTAGNHFELNATASSFTAYKAAFTGASAGKDANSWSRNASELTIANLFTDVANGDLSIVTTNPEAWLVNGKGAALGAYGDDFGATSVRSITVAGGTTDIGADEFTPAGAGLTPADCTLEGAIADAGTTNIKFSEKIIGSLTWHANGGTLPTAVTVKYYSGETPSGASGTYGRGFWRIQAADGSGSWNADLTLNYDDAALGNISTEANLQVFREAVSLVSSGLNTTNNVITAAGLSFTAGSNYDFSLGQSDAPFPVELTTFTARVIDGKTKLQWATATEQNTAMFVIERARNTGSEPDWSQVGQVRAHGNSNSLREYTFTDGAVPAGKYTYRLKIVDNDGTFSYSNAIEADITAPKEFSLSQNYPNPFNPSTEIRYGLPKDSKVIISLYTITGQLVKTLVNENQSAGYHTIRVDASGLSSGMYIYQLNTGNFVSTKKMVVLK